MKQLIYMFLFLLLVSCSSTMDEMPLHKQTSTQFHVSEAKARLIAEDFLSKKDETRSQTKEQANVQYVFSSAKTRSENDTVAYVINYPDNGGFVIISSDNRINPVLAYSTTGTFSFDNEIAYQNFILPLEEYISENTANVTSPWIEDEKDECVLMPPLVKAVNLSQWDPWDKYVIKEHPGCPVGCVAVATALVMTTSIDNLSYHGSYYHLSSIEQGIAKGPEDSSKSPKRIVGGGLRPYPYAQAVDSMAKILYWIGKDVNMNYTTDGSGAVSLDAYNLIKSLKFNITEPYQTYDLIKIAKAIGKKNIVYVRGSGHAWIADGAEYCYDQFTDTYHDVYIHCDWGWGGYGNGYFTGSVFKVGNYNFSPNDFFAVKIMK